MADENKLVHFKRLSELLQRGSIRADILEELHEDGSRLPTETTFQLQQPPGDRRWCRSGDYYNLIVKSQAN